MTRILDNRIIHYAFITLISVTAFLCIFTPDVFLIKRGANFAIQFLFGYLGMGLIFFALNQKRLMYTSLAACGLLCLFLKNSSDQSIKFAVDNANPDISVAHIDLSLSTDFSETMFTIWSTDVDVISFQEYTPDWDEFLTTQLAARYPYQNTLTRIDPYGMAIFSKYPLSGTDTLSFTDIPSLVARININETSAIQIVNARTKAAINNDAYQEIRDHFQMISMFITEQTNPVITLGDFSLPSWSDEVKDFKRIAKLIDSRRDIVPRTTRKPVFLFNIPIDHIFYSDQMECISFRSINSESTGHLGVIGNYQLKELASLEH